MNKMRNFSMIAQYEVEADPETGEWLEEPTDTGELVDFFDWCEKEDTAAAHFDTYEHWPVNDMGEESQASETRAIRVIWKGDDAD